MCIRDSLLIAPHLQHLDHGYLNVHRRLLADLPSLALPAEGSPA